MCLDYIVYTPGLLDHKPIELITRIKGLNLHMRPAGRKFDQYLTRYNLLAKFQTLSITHLLQCIKNAGQVARNDKQHENLHRAFLFFSFPWLLGESYRFKGKRKSYFKRDQSMVSWSFLGSTSSIEFFTIPWVVYGSDSWTTSNEKNKLSTTQARTVL